MKDKYCRHKRPLSHDCVKCIKYKDSQRLKRSLSNEQLKLSMIKEANECTHGNYSSKCGKCPIIQNSDKILCIHGICSSTCEKCLRQKNNVFAIEKNIEKINDEMLCIHGRIHKSILLSYFINGKNI